MGFKWCGLKPESAGGLFRECEARIGFLWLRATSCSVVEHTELNLSSDQKLSDFDRTKLLNELKSSVLQGKT